MDVFTFELINSTGTRESGRTYSTREEAVRGVETHFHSHPSNDSNKAQQGPPFFFQVSEPDDGWLVKVFPNKDQQAKPLATYRIRHHQIDDKFLLEEYKALWKEVEFRLDEIKHIETGGLLGVVAVMAWILVNHAVVHALAALLPFIFVVACIFRVWAVGRHFKIMGNYFSRVEDLYLGELSFGWNRMYWEPRNAEPVPRGRLRETWARNFGQAHMIMWAIVVLSSVAFAVWGLLFLNWGRGSQPVDKPPSIQRVQIENLPQKVEVTGLPDIQKVEIITPKKESK